MDFDIGAVDTSSSMAGVSCFAPSLVFVEINEYDFRGKLEVINLVDNSGNNILSTDNNDLSAIIHYTILLTIKNLSQSTIAFTLH